MTRRRGRRPITHSLGSTDDPQQVFRPDSTTKVVLLAFGAGLLILALMAVIAVWILRG